MTLPEWPREPNTPPAKEMRMLDACAEWSYEMARADAAMARLKLATNLLEKVYSYLSTTARAKDKSLHDEVYKALEAIGELP